MLAGVVIVVIPGIIVGYLQLNLDKLAIHVQSVVVRLIVGALLIHQSDLSRYPLVIEMLVCHSIVAALSLVVMGRRNYLRLMSWALILLKPYGRIGGIVAAAFGGFLIYAFAWFVGSAR